MHKYRRFCEWEKNSGKQIFNLNRRKLSQKFPKNPANWGFQPPFTQKNFEIVLKILENFWAFFGKISWPIFRSKICVHEFSQLIESSIFLHQSLRLSHLTVVCVCVCEGLHLIYPISKQESEREREASLSSTRSSPSNSLVVWMEVPLFWAWVMLILMTSEWWLISTVDLHSHTHTQSFGPKFHSHTHNVTDACQDFHEPWASLIHSLPMAKQF